MTAGERNPAVSHDPRSPAFAFRGDKMKHKLKLIALITTLTVSLSGCFPTGENQLPSNGSETAQPFSGRISEKYGDVELDYEIPADLPTKLPKIKLKLTDFSKDEDHIVSVLFDGKTQVKNENYADWVHFASDNSFLAVSDDEISFDNGGINNEFKHYHYFSATYKDLRRENGEQLNYFSSSEAVERGNKLLDDLGIENYGDPHIIAVTPKEANEELPKFCEKQVTEDSCSDPENEYIPWDEDDGLYILRYKLNFNGVEVPDCWTNLTGSSRAASKAPGIIIGVTKENIVYCKAKRSYDVVSLDNGTSDLIYDAKYASDKLAEHYSKITKVSMPIVFYQCKPEYVFYKNEADGSAVFVPVWCFMGRMSDREDPSVGLDCAACYYCGTGNEV